LSGPYFLERFHLKPFKKRMELVVERFSELSPDGGEAKRGLKIILKNAAKQLAEP
jgi:hypothetical protein